jgi:hypothetical protein
MIAQVVPPDAHMDPWCLVPLATGGEILFGFAVHHPTTRGLSWVRSTPVLALDEATGRATTMSGRRYGLGRRIEPAGISLEGEEAWLAFDLLIGDDAANDVAVPPISTDRKSDVIWLAACKMARHLGIAGPGRAPDAVQAFVVQNIEAYRQLRLPNGRSEESAESLLLIPESEIAAVEATVNTVRRPSSADPARVAALPGSHRTQS